jgi:hypothetical protein
MRGDHDLAARENQARCGQGFRAPAAAMSPVLPGGGVRLAVRFAIFPPSTATVRRHDPESHPLSYRDAGVDIDAGDALVERIKPLARKTHARRRARRYRRFRRPVRSAETLQANLSWCRVPTVSAPSSSLAFDLNRHDTVGQDLVAMSVNDILVLGAESLFFLDYFACGKLERRYRGSGGRRHRQGLRAGGLRADRRRNGRDARHVSGRRIRSGRLSPSASSRSPRIIDGKSTMRPGDVVLGLASSGRPFQRLFAGAQDHRPFQAGHERPVRR